MRTAWFLVLLLLTPAVAADWPSFHGNERNTGSGPGDYRPYNAVWWTRDLGMGQIEASPVVADGVLVAAGSTGKIVALDASSGAEKWNRSMAKGIVSSPAINNGRVYVVDSGGTLLSLDLHTGVQYATASVGATLAGPTVHEGSVYVGNEAGAMFRFEAERLGKEVWKFDTGAVYTTRSVSDAGVTTCKDKLSAGPIRGAPAVYKGKVIFGSNNNWVYAVGELGTGQLQWAYKTGDLVLSSPVVDQDRNRVIVGSYDRKVYGLAVDQSFSVQQCDSPNNAVYARSSNPSWTFLVPSDVGNSAVRATPALAGDRVFVGALNGHVYAISAANGKQVWDHDTGAAVTGSPVVANGTVVVPNDLGRVKWIRAEDGGEIKRFEAEAAIKASPALVQDRTYLATFDGKVSLLGASIPTRPDLAVDVPFLEGPLVKFTVRNRGDGGADATIVRLRVDNEFVADLTVPALAAGATHDLEHSLEDVALPFTVRANVDPSNSVAESDEENNAAEGRFEVPKDEPEPEPEPTDEPDPTPRETDEGIPAAPVLLPLLALLWAVRRRRA